MSAPDLDAVLRKVRALHRMTTERGATEAEATAAAAAAQRLIEQHRLDVSSLNVGEGEPPPEPVLEHEDPLDARARAVKWRELLASSIARANGCRVYRRTLSGYGGRVVTVELVGTSSGAAAVRYLYAWLSREVDRLASEAARGRLDARAYGNAFRLGCAGRVGARLVAAAHKARQGARGSAAGAALVRIDARLARLEDEAQRAERVLAEKKLQKADKLRVSSRDGLRDGAAAGNRVQLGSGPALERGRAALGAS